MGAATLGWDPREEKREGGERRGRGRVKEKRSTGRKNFEEMKGRSKGKRRNKVDWRIEKEEKWKTRERGARSNYSSWRVKWLDSDGGLYLLNKSIDKD